MSARKKPAPNDPASDAKLIATVLGEAVIYAYATARPGTEPDASRIVSFATGSLAETMRRFRNVSSAPVGSGEWLALCDEARVAIEREVARERSEHEAILARVEARRVAEEAGA